MDDQLHIIIAGDRGKVIRIPCNKKKLLVICTSSLVAILFVTITSIFSFSFYAKHRSSAAQVTKLQNQISSNNELIADHNNSKAQKLIELEAKIAYLELARMKQEAAFTQEKEALLTNAVSKLSERSELIEKVVGSIGIKVAQPEVSDKSSENKGGPFIQRQDEQRQELLSRADKYLKIIKSLPFGKPVQGVVTSRYGKRKDPLNKKKAFHEGVDFRAKKGDKIFATADGVVLRAFRNGGYGNYVQISHGNGYSTSFSHMQVFLVKKGEKVKRGQPIGLIGSTGRSTGPHLHYEITLDGKPVNPKKFLTVAKLIK
jgi:murein DD-endopeptidase MepM/ murein hydrolase activator NlpD